MMEVEGRPQDGIGIVLFWKIACRVRDRQLHQLGQLLRDETNLHCEQQSVFPCLASAQLHMDTSCLSIHSPHQL